MTTQKVRVFVPQLRYSGIVEGRWPRDLIWDLALRHQHKWPTKTAIEAFLQIEPGKYRKHIIFYNEDGTLAHTSERQSETPVTDQLVADFDGWNSRVQLRNELNEGIEFIRSLLDDVDQAETLEDLELIGEKFDKIHNRD